jgi:hypothetical protein
VLDDKTREAVVKVLNNLDISQIDKSNTIEKNNTVTEVFSDFLESKTNITANNQINSSNDKSNIINTLVKQISNQKDFKQGNTLKI